MAKELLARSFVNPPPIGQVIYACSWRTSGGDFLVLKMKWLELSFWDFNIIASPDESSCPVDQHMINNDIRDFVEAKNQITVLAHAYNGPLFTWTIKQVDGFLARKLDRVLVNDVWLEKIVDSTVEFLPPEVSDHSPDLLQFRQTMVSPPKPFKFFNYWVKHPEFLMLVESSWRKPINGNPMVILHRKLKRLKEDLKAFNKAHFGG
ncbi:hypothetical protein DITRI_Ditri01bG0062400 [Diplodiscus trichospermus]